MATWNCSGVESSVPATRPTTVVSVSWSTVLPVAPGASFGGRLARRTDSPAANTALRAPGTGHGTCGRGWAERVSSPYGEDLFRLTVTSGAGATGCAATDLAAPRRGRAGRPGRYCVGPTAKWRRRPLRPPRDGPAGGPGNRRRRAGSGPEWHRTHAGRPSPGVSRKKAPEGPPVLYGRPLWTAPL